MVITINEKEIILDKNYDIKITNYGKNYNIVTTKNSNATTNVINNADSDIISILNTNSAYEQKFIAIPNNKILNHIRNCKWLTNTKKTIVMGTLDVDIKSQTMRIFEINDNVVVPQLLKPSDNLTENIINSYYFSPIKSFISYFKDNNFAYNPEIKESILRNLIITKLGIVGKNEYAKMQALDKIKLQYATLLLSVILEAYYVTTWTINLKNSFKVSKYLQNKTNGPNIKDVIYPVFIELGLTIDELIEIENGFISIIKNDMLSDEIKYEIKNSLSDIITQAELTSKYLEYKEEVQNNYQIVSSNIEIIKNTIKKEF